MRTSVIIFAYNRPDNLNKVLLALENNTKFNSFVYEIFIDGPKSCHDKDNVKEVIAIAEIFKERNPCLEIRINKRNKNFGLKSNIESAIKQISNSYDGFIVLEDDIVPNKYFLEFHEMCLIKYKNNKSIMHINGFSYPMLKKGINDITIITMMSCWGWSSWSDRWEHYDSNPRQIMNLSLFEKIRFSRFFSCLFYSHLYGNYTGIVKSWAVFWMLSIFKMKGLCISPRRSMIENIGLEKNGTHKEIIFKHQPVTNFLPKNYPTILKLSYIDELKIFIFHIAHTPVISLVAGFFKIFKKLKK